MAMHVHSVLSRRDWPEVLRAVGWRPRRSSTRTICVGARPKGRRGSDEEGGSLHVPSVSAVTDDNGAVRGRFQDASSRIVHRPVAAFHGAGVAGRLGKEGSSRRTGEPTMTKSTASKVAQDVDATVERPTPWEIRTALVRLLADHAEGLTIPDISERVARELGQPIRDPLEPHVESLMTLGV